jgi:hypothetical protein
MNRTQPPTTRRETIHGGSTPASMRVMVVDSYPRFMSLTVNGSAVKRSMYIKMTAIVSNNYFLISMLTCYKKKLSKQPDEAGLNQGYEIRFMSLAVNGTTVI